MERDFFMFGARAARAIELEGETSGRHVAREMKRALRELSYQRARWTREATPTQAVEWLLDNWYIAQREGLESARCLKKARRQRFSRQESAAVAYVYTLSCALLEEGTALGIADITQFLEGVQAEQPLSEDELAAFFPALRGAIVIRLAEHSRRLGDREDSALLRQMEDTFTLLRTLSAPNLFLVLEGCSLPERIFSEDPAGAYCDMDDESRRRYRRRVCFLARKHGMTEEAAARRVLELAQNSTGDARHVGWYLFRMPLGHPPRRIDGTAYISGIVLPSLLLTLLLAVWLHSWVVAVLLVLPLSDIVKHVIDFFSVHLVRPRPVNRMRLKDGIPPEGTTLCVIAGLLSSAESASEYAVLLERYRLANRDAGENLLMGLLADLPDKKKPMNSADRKHLAEAKRTIDALNQKYGGGYYLFFREPQFQKVDEIYQGWERKRGALLELCRLLRRKKSGLRTVCGSPGALRAVRFVITLDSDTALTVSAAREMAGAMLHPLNRPVIDRRRNVVTAGYGLLQPRISVALGAANRSQFSRIFAGQGGVDPYGGTCSDVYHDLFDEATFTGKGIFDVDAFLTCLDGRFPENRILSHDLLEGSYLRAGLLGEVELTDGFPYKVTSYFARQHRWVRGDWQLLPWLGAAVKNQHGTTEKNPMTPIAKWKIFDNLRRSLVPVCTLLALLLGMCLHGTDFGVAAGVAILAAVSNLLLSGAELAWRRGAGMRARYHATIIAGFGGVILQTLLQLLFLPYQAWICLSAIVVTLWRSFVSGRHLLTWVTAADAERSAGDGVWAHYRRQLPVVVIGAAAIWFSQLPVGAAVGLIWMISPIFSWLLSRPIQELRSVSTADRAFFLHQGAQIWRYFSDFLRAEDHYLPPDNWQEEPPAGLARRTSPTNIGMALLCCMSAADLDYIPQAEAVSLITHMLDTMEGLAKWHGHFYNWYDTEKAQPLHPRYVSTVDGGNLCACLIALREGLYAWGEGELARRAEALSDGMDFSLLYDKRRRLFTIGYDVEREAYTEGWYDLLASEARQTSYIAVARGEVDSRHWRQLGRMLLGENHYSGPASWTGTMFEYFMPHLLMPVEQNSFLYEALSFCVYAQKRSADRRHIPWGISESAFYAFDAAMNYQYKAHGVQALGLKRDLEAETVVAPYAAFLTLPIAPGSAGRNLRRLRLLCGEGKYGLYEAIDFTPARLTGKRNFEVVRSYMSHHLGMSLVAINNALNDNIMQARFMRDCSMSAYRELLQERIPVGAPVLRNPQQDIQERPRRYAPAVLAREGDWSGTGRPECHLLSNGLCHVLCAADGSNRAEWKGLQLTGGDGVKFFVSGKDRFGSLTPNHWRFDGGASWTAKENGLSLSAHLEVPEGCGGEVWEVSVRWNTQGKFRGELALYLEPLLAAQRDFDAHPVFSKLFLESADTGDGVVFTRRPRRAGEAAPACAVIWGALDAAFDTDRAVALGRGGLRAMAQALKAPAHGSIGAVLDPCLLLRIPVALAQNETRKFRVVLHAGEGQEEALTRARRLFQQKGFAENVTLARQRSICRLTEEAGRAAFTLLKGLVYPAKKPVYEQQMLWKYGISGDYPLAVLTVGSLRQAEECAGWLGIHRFLCGCGFPFDLAVLLDEGGDYRRPLRNSMIERMKLLQWEGRIGARAGVHFVDDGAELLQAASVRIGAEEPEGEPGGMLVPNVFTLREGLPDWKYLPDGSVQLTLDGTLPPLGWSQMLTNGDFGWMPDETGCGNLWLQNAREQQVTPWCNDPLQIGGPEYWYLGTADGVRSLFADADGIPCTVTYGPGFARWAKRFPQGEIKTTAFVPPERAERVLLIETDGAAADILYQTGVGGRRVFRISGMAAFVTTAEKTSPEDFGVYKRLCNETVMHWNRTVSALKVHTENDHLNRYLGGWALYQVIACRLLGRTSRYQNGGAFGFRDQLQDACATLLLHEGYARGQIVKACAHQFLEGDVQHWWHEPEGKGVRTRITDDLLWLPYVLAQYLEKWGRRDILEAAVPYLESPVLADGEEERYEQPAVSDTTETVYRHALRAIDCVLTRGTGAHGLLFMGTGDWNDGMNRVGREGKGESVWLTWFAAHVLTAFSAVCEQQGDTETAGRYRDAAQRLTAAAENAWDGDWFLRGYYDSGAPLGSRTSDECRIDSIAQSWAAMVSVADPEKRERALRQAAAQLWDRKNGVVALFTPPFSDGEQDPGYIKGYLPGVRENGGQYTHGAVWLAMGCFRAGLTDEGYGILADILPGGHPQDVYKAEPYVLAADVYTNPQHIGRAGWSWYTGAAGWYYRVATEELLGFRLRAGRLFLEPRLPGGWTGFQAHWRMERASLHIEVRRGEKRTLLDGQDAAGGVPLHALEGEHTLEVWAP